MSLQTVRTRPSALSTPLTPLIVDVQGTTDVDVRKNTFRTRALNAAFGAALGSLATAVATQFALPLVRPRKRKLFKSRFAAATFSRSLGLLTGGAFATGALAMGAVTIGALSIGKVKMKELDIETLRVGRFDDIERGEYGPVITPVRQPSIH
jgi:hypothetical protein